MAVSYIANKLALSGGSEQMQYLGLGLFIIAEAIVFLPLLFIATHFGGEGLVQLWINDLALSGRDNCHRFHN